MNFKEDVEYALKRIGVKHPNLKKSKNPEFGDLSLACFEISDNKNPSEYAKGIAEKIKPKGLLKKAEATGPYVNFFMDNGLFVKTALKEMLKENFGKENRKGKALVEHTSINPNASPHVGRARNALIGDSIVRILDFCGYSTESHYFVNNIGKQIAMLVYASREMKGKITFDNMLRHYIEINRKVIENAGIEKEIFSLLENMESGNQKIKKEFNNVVKVCIEGQSKIFNSLGIKYDYYDYESKFLKSKILKDILASFRKKRKLKKSRDGRVLLNLSKFNLPMREPYLALTRANGTSLYPLRDIAYNVYKSKRAKNGKNIVVLGEDHKLEFQQIKSALEILGYTPPEAVHYAFVLLPDGKMSTRKGNVVLLTEFMSLAVEKSKNEIVKRNPDISQDNLERLSKVIGYGAIKYSILKVSPDKNVIFNWNDALNFEGNSAPYIQYTFVRSKKILEKLKKMRLPKNIVLTDNAEINLLKKMYEFPDVIKNISKDYQVHKLANYLYELANLFNNFYEKIPVIQEKNFDRKMSRAFVVKAYNNLIKNAANLLGMDVPEFM